MTVAKLRHALTVAEFAELAKVSRWTIYRQIKAGRIHASRIGTCIRIDPAELDRVLADGAEV